MSSACCGCRIRAFAMRRRKTYPASGRRAPNRGRCGELCARHGIAPARLELRGFAPIEEAAASYAEIDIALDPFPFCGGMTSLEALWLGVPVITLAGETIATRQTAGMLINLGLSELADGSAPQ